MIQQIISQGFCYQLNITPKITLFFGFSIICYTIKEHTILVTGPLSILMLRGTDGPTQFVRSLWVKQWLRTAFSDGPICASQPLCQGTGHILKYHII